MDVPLKICVPVYKSITSSSYRYMLRTSIVFLEYFLLFYNYLFNLFLKLIVNFDLFENITKKLYLVV